MKCSGVPSACWAGLHLGFCSWGCKIAVSATGGGGGGQALHAVNYNIYSKISRGANIQQGGANAPLRPPKCNPGAGYSALLSVLESILSYSHIIF